MIQHDNIGLPLLSRLKFLKQYHKVQWQCMAPCSDIHGPWRMNDITWMADQYFLFIDSLWNMISQFQTHFGSDIHGPHWHTLVLFFLKNHLDNYIFYRQLWKLVKILIHTRKWLIFVKRHRYTVTDLLWFHLYKKPFYCGFIIRSRDNF